jgi:hypothetical protein
MSDFGAGAAPAAADMSSAPAEPFDVQADDYMADTPNPISTRLYGDADTAGSDAKKPVSTREALEKAADKVKIETKDSDRTRERERERERQQARPTDQRANQKGDQRSEQRLNQQDDRYVARDNQRQVQQQAQQQGRYIAPERFSSDAKVAWETAPEPVKAEVHRAIRELEQGHQKYRADAEAFAEVRDYHELARRHGTSIRDALSRYTGLERRLSSSDANVKAAAVADVLQYAGITPQAYAAYISGQPQEHHQARQDATISSLRQEISTLKHHLGGVTNTLRDQHHTALMTDISKFADAHERFDELAESIAKLIETGMAGDLNEAYSMADRLNPGSSSHAPGRPARTMTDLQAQTLAKGSKSVAGAPSTGSNPGRKGKPTSVRDSLRRAQEQVMG